MNEPIARMEVPTLRTLRVMAFFLLIYASVLGCSGGETKNEWKPTSPRYTSMDQKSRAYSIFKNPKVILLPSKRTFELPRSWIRWFDNYKDNICTSPDQLKTVSEGVGEWAAEYASICNAIFPFDRCAVHSGSQNWAPGSGFGDVQLRVYDIEQSLDELKKEVAARGSEEILRIFKTENTPQIERYKEWERLTFSFEVFYVDYGGIANVDCFLRPTKNRTFVFCFMYVDKKHYLPDVFAILDSFEL